ncbi:hypothetical protein AGDE_00659 [Angomonas deanei]|uniref:Stress responsive A/B Barrel Domain, putative n=1 Tax=Angomonas deanei TaxID=59799 RepID=A0A7G2C6W3_9TRYP|nr:hypothetical protein AGDE_00659 [Angomonas deanei]CAD2215550.1 Stress responsive A/B Barrel Domain, putative [Angomonas deanei]|eukprot:EPY43263.1 hypothetical protein AGDE_00659 [Angomonas deanei]
MTTSYKPLTEEEMDHHTNPVCHIVLFKFKAEPDEETLRKLLNTIRKNIPGLISLYFGKERPNIFKGKTDRTHGYTHALFSRHVNARALEIYQKHPDHVKLGQFFQKHSAAPPIAVDYVAINAKL